MTKKEINSKIIEYILPTNSNYKVDKYLVYSSFEKGFFIKGYLFFSKENSELGLSVSYFVTPLFVKKDLISLTFGGDLYRIERKGLFKKKENPWWDTRKEKQIETFQAVAKCISEQGESILNKYNSAEDFMNQNKKDRDNIRIQEAVAYSSVLSSSYLKQNRELKKLLKIANNDGRNVDWVNQIIKDAELLLEITNIDERINVLKSWANITMEELKLPGMKLFEL